MQNFTCDPELISVLALEIVCPGTLEAKGPWVRYEIAGIEAYSELYVQSHMEDIVMGWDEARGEQPAWADLDDRQRHMVIANVAHYHQTADSDYFDDEWSSRIALVFEDDIVGDPGFVFRNLQPQVMGNRKTTGAIMNAKEVRELTMASARKLPKYEQEREGVRSAIDDAARAGRCCINLFSLRVANEAVVEELREDGYNLSFAGEYLSEVRW